MTDESAEKIEKTAGVSGENQDSPKQEPVDQQNVSIKQDNAIDGGKAQNEDAQEVERTRAQENSAMQGSAKSNSGESRFEYLSPTQQLKNNTLKSAQKSNNLSAPDHFPCQERKCSVVSFQEKCDLYEIDLEAYPDHHNNGPPKPPALFSLRYYIMFLALFSPFVVTYSKTIINFAIIDMIDPNYMVQLQQSNDHSEATSNAPNQIEESSQQTEIYSDTPTPTTVTISSLYVTTNEPMSFLQATSTTTTTTTESVIKTSQDAYFDHDNSCPVDDKMRARLGDELRKDKKRASETAGEQYEWDTVKQGLLKAAYSIGHMLLQVVGGRLSEIYGSHLIMGLSSSLIALACLMAPFFASIHFYLLFFDLLFLGILGSFMTPALITLFSNWLTPSEKSIMLSFYLVSSRLGYALSSLLCGLLINAQLSWRYLFYSAGWVSLIFSTLFFICSRSRPQDHPLIKQYELDYLAHKNTLVRECLAKKTTNQTIQMKSTNNNNNNNNNNNGRDKCNTEKNESEDRRVENEKEINKNQAPWLAILTNGPVWAFVVTKFCVKLAGDTVQIELPTYLGRVMHFSPKDNGFINASNYVIFCISCLVVGALAKTANKRRPFGWSKTAIRKVFQCTASFGVGCVLLGISFNVCNDSPTLILLMLMFFFTTFSTGGEAQIPLDISERYAGTIHAIGSSLAISGVIEPILVGFILKDHPADRDKWAGVWLGASCIAFLGGLVFLVLGDATIQPFDSIDARDVSQKACNTNGATQNQTKNLETANVNELMAHVKDKQLLKRRHTSAELKGYDNRTFVKDEKETIDVKEQDDDDEIRSYRESKEI